MHWCWTLVCAVMRVRKGILHGCLLSEYRSGLALLNWLVHGVCCVLQVMRVRVGQLARVGKLTYTYNGNYEWVFSGHHHRGLR